MSKTTAEGIVLKPSFSKEDLKDVNHIGFVAGIAPNLRDPYSTMYVARPSTHYGVLYSCRRRARSH